jgi:hypothetical protein
MKKLLLVNFAFLLLLLPARSALAQCTVPNPTPDPNQQRVIDARPNRIFAAKGKTRFGERGTVLVVNMNPFLFEGYRITVQEEEIKDEALIKFVKALIPVAGSFAENASAEKSLNQESAGIGEDINLAELITRLSAAPAPSKACPSNACTAMQRLIYLKNQLVAEEQLIGDYFVPRAGGGPTYRTPTYLATKAGYIQQGTIIFNRDTDTPALCTAANTLRGLLIVPTAYPTQDDVTKKQKEIEQMVSKARALKKAIDLYKGQDGLKETIWTGSTGFNYLEDLDLFAQELIGAINTKYAAMATKLFTEVLRYDNMKEAITNLNGREKTLLQQEFPIGGKYDFSKVTVTVQPFGEKTPQDKNGGETVLRDGDAPAGNNPSSSGQNGSLSSPSNTGSGSKPPELAHASAGRFTEAAGDDKKSNDDKPAPAPAGPAKISDFVTTGKPRFEIGVGMAYSQVDKREFQSVSGFARDRDGNLTNGETFTKIVGFSEKTDHRFTPIALLHTRLTNNPNYNLYFSLGITGSRDKLGTNIEYLIGPSVNITDQIFITAGAFAARQHQLAGDDLFTGAAVPDGFDSIPVRSRYQWKPGLSFSYRLPVTGSSKKKAAAESGAAELETYTDTLYVGQPIFSISAGMAYSPLRQQSFQPIIGFARDRDGNLTGGETFTKIVGFNENSDGRFLPMALLNTRIKSNDQFGLHFSLGITAKRTDEKTDVEYLIGPSFSFMRNQIMFTAGAYAGKQQKIAGDLFVNAPLSSGLTLTTEREYHFKPGIAFSYRLPVKLP